MGQGLWNFPEAGAGGAGGAEEWAETGRLGVGAGVGAKT